MKWKRIIFDVVAIILLSFILYPFRTILSSPTAYINGTDGDELFSPDRYWIIHAASAVADTSISVSLVDISDLFGPDSHDQIAVVIDRIMAMHPRVVAVDVTFSALSGKGQDSLLTSVVRSHCDSLVFIMDLKDYDASKKEYLSSFNSFFTDSIPVSEGFSNLCNQRDQQPVIRFSPVQLLNGRRVFSLPLKMAADICDTSFIATERYLINYMPIYFPRMSHHNLDSTLIANRYVFLGGLWANDDMFNTPLGLKSGMEIHAYTLNTLLEGELMGESTAWFDYFLGLLVCAMFSFLLVIIDYKLSRKESAVLKYIGQESLVSLGVTYIVTWLLGFIGYILFMNGIYLSMTVALSIVLRVTVAAKIFYVFFVLCVSSYTNYTFSLSTYSSNKQKGK